jgi:hypothetical protein
MARTTFGITTTAITWEKELTEITVNETGLAEISVEGAVNSTGIGIESALDLIPSTLPSGASGPMGVTTKYAGAKISSKGASYTGGTWQVRATYTKTSNLTATFPDDGTVQAEEDRYERRIIGAEVPILTHPVVRKFAAEQINKLANLVDGNIVPNINYDPNNTGTNPEFQAFNPSNGEYDITVEFSTQLSTSGDVSACPLDYARLIKGGILSYYRPSIRHLRTVTRNQPATNSEYNQVSKVVPEPPGAPTLSDDRQWLLSGITDSSSNNETWTTTYEYEASEAGGILRPIYAGGEGEIDQQ